MKLIRLFILKKLSILFYQFLLFALSNIRKWLILLWLLIVLSDIFKCNTILILAGYCIIFYILKINYNKLHILITKYKKYLNYFKYFFI